MTMTMMMMMLARVELFGVSQGKDLCAFLFDTDLETIGSIDYSIIRIQTNVIP
jgi:hypothetical protein